MKHLKQTLFLTALIAFCLSSCKKKEVEPEPETPVEIPSYTVPTTYDFGTNTNYLSSTQRVGMFKELLTYVRSTHNATAQVTIDAAKMKNMFSNSGSPFADASFNSSGINIKEKINNNFGAVSEMELTLDEAASVSQSTVEGSNGVAGKVLGPVPTSSTAVRSAYLLNARGFEYKELVEKGVMGSLLYAEATTILNKISTYDNTNAEAGKGTAMEHAWDEAFGYFGVPAAFPTSTVGLLYWGSYCNAVNGAIGSNSTIMNAWLKGRAAISNKDAAGRDAARDIVVSTWEKVGAARFITYVKQAKTNFANDAQRNHALSEGAGFLKAFKYNSKKTISDADVALMIGYIGDNLYNVSQTNLDLAINKMASIFGLDTSKL